MALSGLITGLSKKISNTLFRRGNYFVCDTEVGPVYSANTLGRVKGGTVVFEPINSEKDSTGRVNTLGYNVVVTAILMQTTEDEIAAAGALSAPEAGDDGQNGFDILVTADPQSEAAAATIYDDAINENSQDVGSVLFRNALVQTAINLDFSGGESTITLTIEGHISAATLRSFADNFNVITFDA